MSKRKFSEITAGNILNKDDILVEDSTLKYDFMISLTNIAAVKIVTNLWMSEDIQQRIVNLYHSSPEEKENTLREIEGLEDVDFYSFTWVGIQTCVINKVPKLVLPESFSKMIKSLVPSMGKSLRDWIEYHDKYIFSLHSAVDVIDSVKWTTRGGISYEETAKHVLFRPDKNLNDDCIFKLACTFCLRETIGNMAPKVLSNQWYLNGVDINKYPMVYFWTAHVTGNNTMFYDPFEAIHIQGVSHNEYILQLLIRDFEYDAINEIAIKHVWNELSDKEKVKNVSTLIEREGCQEFKLSLLSGLEYEERQKVFKKYAFPILRGLLDNWLLEKYFLPTALRLLDHVDPELLMLLLEVLAGKMSESLEEERECDYARYKLMLKELCQASSMHIKDLVSESGHIHYLLNSVTVSLSWEEDIDLIDLIFSFFTVEQKRSISLGYDGIARCVDFINAGRWDLLELLIQYTLLLEEDLRELKQDIIENEGEDIVVQCAEEGDFDKLQHFMDWAFSSKEEMDQFKQNFPCSDIREESSMDESKMNRLVEWCAISS